MLMKHQFFLLIMTHNCRLVLKTCDVIMATTKCQSIQANRELSSSHAQVVKKKYSKILRREDFKLFGDF